MSPIVPRASISGRALVAVVAIMTFLASITTGTVLLVSASAAEWQSEVASEITIQVRPLAGRDLDRDAAAVAEAMRAQPGIIEIRPFSKDESAKLLEPWLGSGLSLDDLPVPRVIVARLQPGATLDLAALRGRVTQAAPSATVDDHRAWIERMRSMTGATVFAGIGILALVIIATIISVSFATRGAMAANRPIVEVLHFVGAGDSYIANRFLRHFLRLGLEGGLIGGGAAMLGFGFSESIAGWFSGTPVGDQFAALLGTFSLRPSGYLALAAQAVLIAAITAWASRRTLFSTLDDID
jgi:cell division transport system permease protein